MRYAIIESGGKQYKAVEGQTLEVDRLGDDEGSEIRLDRVLLMADDADFMIGTPTLTGVEVKATVVDHISGRKVTHFRYSPKKRIRVRGGHRQQYTRLLVNFIGSHGEVRKSATPEPNQAEPVAKPAASKAGTGQSKRPGKQEGDRKRPAQKSVAPAKKPAASPAKKSSK